MIQGLVRKMPRSGPAWPGFLLLVIGVLGASCTAPATVADSRQVELDYRVSIRDLPADAKTWVAWIPLPSSDPWQTVEDLRWDIPYPAEAVEDAVYGNRFLRVAGQAPPAGDVELAIHATVIRRSVRPEDFARGPSPEAASPRYLEPDRLIPLDGPIADEAARVAPAGLPPLSTAALLYKHVVATVRYDKSIMGWGKGDALRACDLRTGNCTDFHSLFIGLSRARGLPARFVMGVPLPADLREGEVAGYHCWAEFHTPEGWRPVDASEAAKHPELAGVLFSGLDSDRVAFSVGRDIPLPGAAAEPLNYAIWPHVEVAGQVHEAVDTSIRFREAQSGPSLGQAAGPDPCPRRP